MRNIAVGAIFLALGCVAYVLAIAFGVAPLAGGDLISAIVGTLISAIVAGVSISWGGYLLLYEPLSDEEAIRLAERAFWENVNN